MHKNKRFHILKKILNKEKIQKYEKELIYQDDDGTFRLYGVFTINKENGYYTVRKIGTHEEKSFSELKNSVTWVTLEQRNRFADAERVHLLDALLSGAKESSKIHENLYKKTKDIEQRSIYVTKLVEDRFKQKSITDELEEYVTSCKRWQLKQFSLSTSK